MTNSVPKSANRIDKPIKRRRFRFPRASAWFALVIALHGLLQLTLGVGRLVAPDVVLIRNDSGDEVSGLAVGSDARWFVTVAAAYRAGGAALG